MAIGVSYKKLWIMLIEKDISRVEFRSLANLSPATMTKLNRNDFVSLQVIARICKSLCCNIGDVVDVTYE